MMKVDELKSLANEYQSVEKSNEFKCVRNIRNNFVHNKSTTYYGMNVDRQEIAHGVIAYASYNSGVYPQKKHIR